MSTAHWLSAREDGVPSALAGRVGSALGTRSEPESNVTDDLIAAAEDVLRGVLSVNPMTRTQALDLLAADALATYAFEAAADDPPSFSARADAAMRRFAALAEVPR